MMNNSFRFFENKECEYYPCHKGISEMNCLFCYCPLYHLKDCPGNSKFATKNGKEIKICTDCTFPHRAENYEKVIEILKKQSQ